MRPLLQMSLYVRLCVGHTGVLCNSGWTDRDAVWGAVGPRNCVLDGVEILHGKGNFWGCSTHWKAFATSAAVYAAKWIIQCSITARHEMWPFVRILWDSDHLLLLLLLLKCIVLQKCWKCALDSLDISYYPMLYIWHWVYVMCHLKLNLK